MDNYFRKSWYPSANPKKSQGINDAGVFIDQGVTVKKKCISTPVHEMIDKHFENLPDKYKIPVEQPKFYTNCIETILNWLDKYDIILGMQMNLTHPDILHKLTQKNCRIIVQYHPWMDCANRRTDLGIKKNFLRVKEIYPLLNWKNNPEHQMEIVELLNKYAKDDEGDHPAHKLNEKGMGIGVFKHIPRENEFDYIMHHKFLVGSRLKNGRYSVESVIYGSFNLSSSATNNLESILVWENNPQLAAHMYVEYMVTCNTSQVTLWEDFVRTEKFIENDRDYPNVYV